MHEDTHTIDSFDYIARTIAKLLLVGFPDVLPSMVMSPTYVYPITQSILSGESPYDCALRLIQAAITRYKELIAPDTKPEISPALSLLCDILWRLPISVPRKLETTRWLPVAFSDNKPGSSISMGRLSALLDNQRSATENDTFRKEADLLIKLVRFSALTVILPPNDPNFKAEYYFRKLRFIEQAFNLKDDLFQALSNFHLLKWEVDHNDTGSAKLLLDAITVPLLRSKAEDYIFAKNDTKSTLATTRSHRQV